MTSSDRTTHRPHFRLALAVALFALIAAPLAAQDSVLGSASAAAKPRIAVFGFLNFTGDDTFDNPTETATNGISLSLRIIGLYEVVESDIFLRDQSDASLAQYCKKNNFDYVLYGTLKTDGLTQRYTLGVFDLSQGKTTIRESAIGSSVLDVFSVTDTLIQAVLGSITGHHIGFGSLRLTNAGESGSYEVVIDGISLPESPASIDYVMSGSHTLRVVKTSGPAPVEVLSRTVEVVEGTATAVSFSLPSDPVEPEPVVVPTGVVPAVAEPVALAPVEPVVVEPEPEPESAEETAPEEEIPPKEDPFKIRYWNNLALYGSYGIGQGKYAEMVDRTLGGGFVIDKRLGARTPLCFVFSGDGNLVSPTHDDIAEFQDGAVFFGFSCQLPFLYVFTLRPALSAGIWVNRIILSDNAGIYDQSGTPRQLNGTLFAEPALQATIDLQISFKSFGLFVAPTVTGFPTKSGILYYVSARAGIVTRFNRMR